MKRPPCKVDGIDCPRRYIGCKSDCEEWHKWLAIHEAERAREKQDKYNEADSFLIKQQERIKQARHRDYMRGYKRK